MARIKAFKGVRPRPELAEKVCSQPYDVINTKEARQLAEGNPYSFLYVNRPEISLPDGVDLYSDEVYEAAKKSLDKLIDEGTMIQDDKPVLYAYQQEWRGLTQTGLITCVSADDYDEDLVKKHEKTRKDKEDDRARHVDETGANTGLVFLTYRADKKVDDILAEATKGQPVYEFSTSDKVKHRFFVINDAAEVDGLVNEFKNVTPLYVADGHHRAASGSRVRALRKDRNAANHTGNEEYNYFMAGLFPDDQLQILAYNRVVKDLKGMSADEFLAKLEENFEMEKCEKAPKLESKQFGMYLESGWIKLSAKPSSYDAKHPVESLDAAILQKNLLDAVLGIEDPRSDKRIDFVGGIHGDKKLEELVDSGEFKLAFSLYPTSMTELMSVADASMMMPPKSTWFEPKLRSGLIVHLLD